MSRVAVYFVASPLQYLAARQIALRHEQGARQVLVWYQPGVEPVVRPQDWDASAYMPWPRRKPLPGPFGRHRRLRANVRLVAGLVGRCDELHLHSAVFDTEAVNCFLHALPKLSGASSMRARILPDGLINVRRYPLSAGKRALMWVRGLRGLVAPELRYTRFAGDRIGSDAPFCDRIYLLPGFPHEYPPEKVVTLEPLAGHADAHALDARRGVALIIGQPLTGNALLDAPGLAEVTRRMRHWLAARGIRQVLYKPHPKDRHAELSMQGDEVLSLDEPIETWLTRQSFDAVVGVRSTTLLFARQVYGPETTVAAFGWDLMRFRSDAERRSMQGAFERLGVLVDPPARAE